MTKPVDLDDLMDVARTLDAFGFMVVGLSRE